MQAGDTLTPTEAAEILKLKPDTVIRMIRAGKIAGTAVGNGTKRHRWILRRHDVMAYIENNQFSPENNITPLPRPRIQRAGYPMLEKYKARLAL